MTITDTAGNVLLAAAPADPNTSSRAIGSTTSAAITAAATTVADPPERGAPETVAALPSIPSPSAGRLNPFGLLSSRPISTTVRLARDGLQVQASFSGVLPLQGGDSGLLQWSLWLCIGLIALAAVGALGRTPAKSREQRLEDLRERSRVMAALQEAEASQQVLRDEIARTRQDRDRILASVGHDVRTPMTSILGLTSLLQDADLQDEHRRWVGMIAASSQTLLAMLNGLLEIARGEEGEALLMIEDVDMTALIGDVSSVLDTQAREKGLELITRVDDSLTGVWRADPTRLRQTLFNLLGNAIKYTSAGHVEVSARAGLDTGHGRRIRLCVSDTGPGIPQSDRERIFEPFNRGSRGDATALAGLGLALCRDNAALMGGTLTLESTVGVGTEFTFEFCAEQVKAPLQVQRFKGATAVIVGFTDVYRRQVAQHLNAAGFLVETAADGFIGLGLIERTVSALGSADLAIADGSMLGMPAETLIRRLRATAFSAKVRLIVIAGSDNAGSLRELPVDALIRAPGELPEIAAAVDRVMIGWSPLQMLDPDTSGTPENRILVVEDDPVNRSLLTSLLSARGFSVFTANNGEDAVRISVRGRFQAILMDIQLPGIDGFEAGRRIRAMNHAVREVPILALTALTGPVVKRRSQEAGMTAVIEKPVDPHRLAETVRKYIAQAHHDNAIISNDSQTARGAEQRAGGSVRDSESDGLSAAFLEAVVEDLGEVRAGAALDTFIADTNTRLGRLGKLASAWERGSIIRVCREISELSGTFGAISLSEALDEVVAAVERQDRELARRQIADVERLTARLAPALKREFDAMITARANRRAA